MTSDEDSASRPGMFARLKAGLARSTAQLTSELTGVFTKERLDADTVRDLEDALIRADVGTGLAHELGLTEVEPRSYLRMTLERL